MTTFNEPVILTDRSRLQEIYDLRVLAYEHSPKKKYVNRNEFPNGWFDHLDDKEQTIHWIIEDNDLIIASARLAILDDIEDTNESFSNFEIPNDRPFAYWSRLVVHPNYRNTPAMLKLDTARKNYLLINEQIKFAVSVVSKDRNSSMLRQGFKLLGEDLYNWGEGRKSSVSIFLYS